MTYLHKIIDINTGEETILEYTADQLAEVELAELEQKNKLDELNSKNEQKKLLLEKLGITEDEAKLLLA